MKSLLDKIFKRHYELPVEEINPELTPEKIDEAKEWSSKLQEKTDRIEREFYRYRLELALEARNKKSGEKSK